MKQGAAIMPDALRWLWREYPNPIVAKEPAAMTPSRDGIRAAKSIRRSRRDKPWEQVGETYGAVASPAADKDGNVYFADSAANRIYKSDADRQGDRVQGELRRSAGAARGSRRAAVRIAAGTQAHRVVRPGRRREGGRAKCRSERHRDHRQGRLSISRDTARKTVGYVDAGAKRASSTTEAKSRRPSGLALSPDQAMLIVTDAQSRFSWSFQIAPDGVADQWRAVLPAGDAGNRMDERRAGRTQKIRSAKSTSRRRSAFRCARRTAAWR